MEGHCLSQYKDECCYSVGMLPGSAPYKHETLRSDDLEPPRAEPACQPWTARQGSYDDMCMDEMTAEGEV